MIDNFSLPQFIVIMLTVFAVGGGVFVNHQHSVDNNNAIMLESAMSVFEERNITVIERASVDSPKILYTVSFVEFLDKVAELKANEVYAINHYYISLFNDVHIHFYVFSDDYHYGWATPLYTIMEDKKQ